MGFVFLAVVVGYLVLAAVAVWLTKRLTTSKKAVLLVAALFFLFPFRRFLLFHALFFYYRTSPLQEIRQTVAAPVSVYWEDKVWPGFDEYGRHWMVENYLDGVHLQMLALNGEDGNIYLYRATMEDFAESEKLRPEYERIRQEIAALEKEALEVGRRGGDKKELWQVIRQRKDGFHEAEQYWNQRRSEIEAIIARVAIHQGKESLPPVRYRVEFNPLPLGTIPGKLLHADRIGIVDVQQNREIAYSRRYLAYAGFMSQISGEQPKFDYKLGDMRAYEFDDRVLFEYAGVRDSLESTKDKLDRSFYHLIQ